MVNSWSIQLISWKIESEMPTKHTKFTRPEKLTTDNWTKKPSKLKTLTFPGMGIDAWVRKFWRKTCDRISAEERFHLHNAADTQWHTHHSCKRCSHTLWNHNETHHLETLCCRIEHKHQQIDWGLAVPPPVQLLGLRDLGQHWRLSCLEQLSFEQQPLFLWASLLSIGLRLRSLVNLRAG